MTEFIDKDLASFYSITKLYKPITFFGSARINTQNEYYDKAKNLAYECVKSGFCVISGAGGGIMEASNLGASLACEELLRQNLLTLEEKERKSVGFNIILPFEQKVNEYVGYNITFKSLAIRKMALIEKSLAFVIFPGGFGTLDELIEVLTLKQLGFKNVPIFVVGKSFWQGFDAFIKESLLALKLISPEDTKLYELSDDLGYILEQLKDRT